MKQTVIEDDSVCSACQRRIPLWRTEYGWLHIQSSSAYSRTTYRCGARSGRSGYTMPWDWEQVQVNYATEEAS